MEETDGAAAGPDRVDEAGHSSRQSDLFLRDVSARLESLCFSSSQSWDEKLLEDVIKCMALVSGYCQPSESVRQTSASGAISFFCSIIHATQLCPHEYHGPLFRLLVSRATRKCVKHHAHEMSLACLHALAMRIRMPSTGNDEWMVFCGSIIEACARRLLSHPLSSVEGECERAFGLVEPFESCMVQINELRMVERLEWCSLADSTHGCYLALTKRWLASVLRHCSVAVLHKLCERFEFASCPFVLSVLHLHLAIAHAQGAPVLVSVDKDTFQESASASARSSGVHGIESELETIAESLKGLKISRSLGSEISTATEAFNPFSRATLVEDMLDLSDVASRHQSPHSSRTSASLRNPTRDSDKVQEYAAQNRVPAVAKGNLFMVQDVLSEKQVQDRNETAKVKASSWSKIML
ncbi:hypothetical protein FVE85_9449 [Porphyridium purpureum]|uniref:Uncharacterized protein n=1 Tax=Porphyridium purpureum TaxID=35688 RepID=A0A5J4YK66_PORPP|nr:hypothetical protein FVE85_9449 [Porphyridium purpureum]|eukprot:POR6961..scf261_15